MWFLPDDRSVETSDGKTLLELALDAGIPHAHACGGEARCSTCRVLVTDGLDRCSPRDAAEVEVADRAGLSAEVRLACQTRVLGDVTVRRLVVDPLDEDRLDLRTAGRSLGRETEVAVVFADLRGFTHFAAGRLPYDVIDVLDRLTVDAVAAVEQRHGGRLTAFLGDGVMGVFGADGEDDPSGRAVAAGLELVARAAERRGMYRDLYGVDLILNVGVHHGPAVVGEVSWRQGGRLLTAVGETVNLAQRIEQANKLVGSQLLVSEEVARRLEGRAVSGRTGSVPVGGGELEVVEVLGLA